MNLTTGKRISDLIGHTPLIDLTERTGGEFRLLGKLEGINPGGSSKDRTALWMIRAAEAAGTLNAGYTIVEPTSGNTGIAIAMLAAERGYRALLTMPETVSPERIKLMRAYGAQVITTPGLQQARELAEEKLAADTKAIMLDQFSNPANPRAHLESTGPEILQQTQGQVDVLVAGVGTGGTISGVAQALKHSIPGLHTVAVEPVGSPVISGGEAGPHSIQGIGAGFLPANLNLSLLDRVQKVTDDAARKETRWLARKLGVLVGISSGAALAGALAYCSTIDCRKKTVVIILPDRGDRYLSGDLYL